MGNLYNKENGNYRPHYYAIQDKTNPKIYWMIPISSQVEKYKLIIKQKEKKYGKCNTIVIGKFAGKENAFLIQNAFPIIDKIHFTYNRRRISQFINIFQLTKYLI